jgi:3-oxoacyl-[acyl-carrier-protein] synthase II
MPAVHRRVVITGAGVVSSVGTGVQGFWDGLLEERSVAAWIDIEGVGRVPAFAVAEGEDARERFGQREARRMDRSGRLAAVAAALALEDAGDLGADLERVGASIGSVHGGPETLLEAHRALLERGMDRVGPLAIPLSLTNHPCAATARALGLRGPSAAPATACAAGSDAIGAALGTIRDGRADAMVAGGAEAPLSPLVVAGYLRVGALSAGGALGERASRPFDRARNGFVIGEGAGIVVLEERERALARGARIYAELAGYGSSCDAGHPTDPDASGAGPARAMREALRDAGLAPEDVGYVNAHATSTIAGDLAEARAIEGAGLSGAAVSSTKSAHGHPLGGAGGMEAVATLMAFARDVLPATLNLEDPDPEPVLDHVRTARRARVGAAISNSFGFGGHNACLVFVRHEPV